MIKARINYSTRDVYLTFGRHEYSYTLFNTFMKAIHQDNTSTQHYVPVAILCGKGKVPDRTLYMVSSADDKMYLDDWQGDEVEELSVSDMNTHVVNYMEK